MGVPASPGAAVPPRRGPARLQPPGVPGGGNSKGTQGLPQGLATRPGKVEGDGPSNQHDYGHHLLPAIPNEQPAAEAHDAPLGLEVRPDEPHGCEHPAEVIRSPKGERVRSEVPAPVPGRPGRRVRRVRWRRRRRARGGPRAGAVRLAGCRHLFRVIRRGVRPWSPARALRGARRARSSRISMRPTPERPFLGGS